MRKFLIFTVSLGIGSAVLAQTVSELLIEFQRRDAILFDAEEGQILSFLNSLSFDLQTMTDWDLFDSNQLNRFVLKMKDGDVCYGDILEGQLRCLTEIGQITVNFPEGAEGSPILFDPALVTQTTSELFKEFHTRNSMIFSPEEEIIFSFLKELQFNVLSVKKLDLFDPNHPNRFVLETRKGDVCFGDVDAKLVRCKNEMGITTTSYAGDSD